MSASVRETVLFVMYFSAFGYLLHLGWEYLQCAPFFYHGEENPTVASMLFASTGDVFMMFLVYATVALVKGSLRWFAADWNWKTFMLIAIPSVALALLVERVGLHIGRWKYTSVNPLIPGIEISILPILQMLFINPLTFYLSKITVSLFSK
ncbi:MAG: hypothetical protein AB7G93_13185 [Bdellovibrionales bacterium]